MRAALLFLILFGALAPAATSEEVPAGIDQTIRAEMQRANVEGLAIAVLRDGQLAWSRGYGRADIESGEKITSQTTFQAASLGKVSAAYAAMILIDRGVLTLDTPLVDPRLKVQAGCTHPTVMHALSHTTGMGNDLTAASFEPDCAPRKAFSYSGQGYSALATTIERATGKTVTTVIDELVFAPLAMRATRYGPPIGDARASGHASLLTSYLVMTLRQVPFWLAIGLAIALTLLLVVPTIAAWRTYGWAAGVMTLLATTLAAGVAVHSGQQGNAKAEAAQPPNRIASSLSSNVDDLAKFMIELARPTLLSKERVDVMLAARTTNDSCVQWSLIMGIDTCAERKTYWQWASNLGFQGLMVLDPERGDGVVILANTGGGLDVVFPGRGGYPAAKAITRKIMNIQGAWQVGAQPAARQ